MAKKTAGSRSQPRATPRRTEQARRGAHPATTSRRATAAPQRWRLSWARRIGIAGGLLLAVVSVAVAAQKLGPGLEQGFGQSPGASAPANGSLAGVSAPVLDPITAPASGDTIDVHGSVAADVAQAADAAGYRLRVYVNNRFRRDVRLTSGDDRFVVGGVPLEQGTNSITATIAVGDKESAGSAPVTVDLDTSAPTIDITSPTATTVYGDTLLLTGTTEPGAQMTLTNRTTSTSTDSTAAPSGDFSLSLHLQPGANVLDISAVDAAGNQDQKRMTLMREVSQASVTLELSRDSYDLATLPQTITVTAHVIGPDGKPANDASLTFSISPPGQTTVTRQTRTVDGTASWNEFPLTVPGATGGRGLVTALATLADGETVAGSATFLFR
jgi:hypothetical protein